MSWVLVLLALIGLWVLVLSVRRNEPYAMLDGSFTGGFERDVQNEDCFTMYDRIYGIHDMGFDPWRCSNMKSGEYKQRMKTARLCAIQQCGNGDDACKNACIAQQFARNPLTDQTALPLLQFS